MRTFGRIDSGRLVEVVEPAAYGADVVDEDGNVLHHAGDEIAIEDRFTPELVATLVDITDLSPLPTVGMVYDGTAFSAYVPPPLNPEQILADNTARRDALLLSAAAAIAPLQDAVDLDMATDAETVLLKQWKQYRVAVSRVDLNQQSPLWPTEPSS